jgi:hypothetical protein
VGATVVVLSNVTFATGGLPANWTSPVLTILGRSQTAGYTGANLVWTAAGTVYRGIMTDNTTLVATALSQAYDSVVVTPGGGDGIKVVSGRQGRVHFGRPL